VSEKVPLLLLHGSQDLKPVLVDAGDDRSIEDLADGAGFVLSSDLND
jgi:hypothetical protein